MFDYSADAELFSGRRGRRQLRSEMKYRRFPAAAEAVRFAIEALPPDMLGGAYLEVNEERFDAAQIRVLYDSSDFPLPREKARPA